MGPLRSYPPGRRLDGLSQLESHRPRGRKRSSWISIESLLKCFMFGAVSFYGGMSVGWNMQLDCQCSRDLTANSPFSPGDSLSGQENELKRLRKLVAKYKDNELKLVAKCKDDELKGTNGKTGDKKDALPKPEPFHQEMFEYRHTGNVGVQGFGVVDRDEFFEVIDSGVPKDNTGWANDQVVLLYSDGNAMPDRNATWREHPRHGKILSMEDATKNCRSLHVIYSPEARRKQCTAITAQYESHHIAKFMRMADKERRDDRIIDMNLPLRLVNRQMTLQGEKAITVPDDQTTTNFWKKSLLPYLNAIDGVLEELKPIANSVASNNKHNTIIVMVCNLGHSELLLNFVCNARAKGSKTEAALKNILVFATDAKTHQLAQNLGLTSFYSEKIFGRVPEKAAGEYGDVDYSIIMGSKVYCVHLISQLGHDLLFQDVDIVWYKDPLSFFHNEAPDHPAKKWDMIFQDDGARNSFFAPYSANTGFYFVRNSKLTRNFFNACLMNGNLILQTGSHQAPLISALAEASSLYGLKIKTWSRWEGEFPGGFTYHDAHQVDKMKQLILNKNSTEGRGLLEPVKNVSAPDPYIFHMSWTANKDDKIKYFRQMGEWFLNDECNPNKDPNSTVENPSIRHCCLAKPVVTCFYKNKPSIIPCPNAPCAGKRDMPSFW